MAPPLNSFASMPSIAPLVNCILRLCSVSCEICGNVETVVWMSALCLAMSIVWFRFTVWFQLKEKCISQSCMHTARICTPLFNHEKRLTHHLHVCTSERLQDEREVCHRSIWESQTVPAVGLFTQKWSHTPSYTPSVWRPTNTHTPLEYSLAHHPGSKAVVKLLCSVQL